LREDEGAIVASTEDSIPSGLIPESEIDTSIAKEIINAVPHAIIAATNLDFGDDFFQMMALNFQEGSIEGYFKGFVNGASGLMEYQYDLVLNPAKTFVDVVKDAYAFVGAVVTTDDTANLIANMAAKAAETVLPAGGAASGGIELPQTPNTEKAMETIGFIDMLKTLLGF